MTIDTTVHLGDLVTAVVGGILTFVGWGLRRFYRTTTQFFERVDGYDGRLEHTAEVVDKHSSLMVKNRWVSRGELRKLSRRRRQTDTDVELSSS